MKSVNELGRWVMGLGVAIIVLGALMQVPRLFGWFGRLPGDMRFGNTTVLIGSGIAVSLILTLVLNLLAAFLRRR